VAVNERAENQRFANDAFHTELGILAHLGEKGIHENIVRLISRVELDSNVFIAIEYCSGGDLKSYLVEKILHNCFVDEVVDRSDDDATGRDHYKVTATSISWASVLHI
jgi:serine/threonine protein kinase